jgi:hypothetical protein
VPVDRFEWWAVMDSNPPHPGNIVRLAAIEAACAACDKELPVHYWAVVVGRDGFEPTQAAPSDQPRTMPRARLATMKRPGRGLIGGP